VLDGADQKNETSYDECRCHKALTLFTSLPHTLSRILGEQSLGNINPRMEAEGWKDRRRESVRTSHLVVVLCSWHVLRIVSMRSV